MTKQELVDRLFHAYLIWCVKAPTGPPSELLFWLDHKEPTEDNFWLWVVQYKKAPKLGK